MKTVLFATLLTANLLGGCTVHRPVAYVRSVALTDQTAEGGRVVVTVELDNQGETPLPLTEASYTVAVDGYGSFRFTEVQAATMAANATQRVSLAAAFATDAAGLAGRSYHAFGRLFYEPPGEIRRILTDAGIPLPSVGFAASGRLEPME